ncbi:Gfo/Idh/MocA family protein [Amnibacterium flavum]|uniref:Oxidoreductase n=1 Tax=Amnibacterium flavum TaxID=2173173 RepID=A0A2V1HNN3_9MICO|nr:Gfo/Idh/MocA family oxidoreductase [Amnibacterium flavum]PVZ94196.1 oxidoreductase [Amnibacterium flavum]
MADSTIGVGILGCGPVTQAIHIPTIDRIRDSVQVVNVMDVNAQVAEAIASRVESRWTTSADELIADPAVEIVVVCSPNKFHAAQVIAACRAGKKAVLCEKPLALTEAEAREIAQVSAETGVPVVVGAMHTFDPAWLSARAEWGDLVETAHTIRYSIVLTPNTRSEDFASEIFGRPGARIDARSAVDIAADVMHGSIMGLAIHDLPLVRVFCPDFTDVELLSSQVLDPGGYLVNLRVGAKNVQLYGLNNESWRPEWRFEAVSDDTVMRIDFPPPYVHAGSGVTTFFDGESTRSFGPTGVNGYEREWRYVADLARGEAEPLDVSYLADDLAFAVGIADAATANVRARFGSEVTA